MSFVPDGAGLDALLHSPAVGSHLLEVADLAAAEARNVAPVGTGEDPHPGQFRDSIVAELGVRADGQQTGRVFSTDPNALYIEFGTSDTPAHHSLRRGVESLGLLIE